MGYFEIQPRLDMEKDSHLKFDTEPRKKNFGGTIIV